MIQNRLLSNVISHFLCRRKSGKWTKLPQSVVLAHDLGPCKNLEDMLTLGSSHSTIEIHADAEAEIDVEFYHHVNSVMTSSMQSSMGVAKPHLARQVFNTSDLQRVLFKSDLIDVAVFNSLGTNHDIVCDMIKEAKHVGLKVRVNMSVDLNSPSAIYPIVDSIGVLADIGTDWVMLFNSPSCGEVDEDVVREIAENAFNLDVPEAPMKNRLSFAGSEAATRMALESGILNIGTRSLAPLDDSLVPAVSIECLYQLMEELGIARDHLRPNVAQSRQAARDSVADCAHLLGPNRI